MTQLLPYVFKTLWGHRARTILTISGTAVALFVFCFVTAVQDGMNGLRRRQESERSLVIFQANKFCPATSHLPQDYQRRVRSLRGVREVVPIQVFTNNCRASLDVVVFYGLPPELLEPVRDLQLLEGSWPEFVRHRDTALVGSAVAQRRRIVVGEKFSLGGITVTVAGIFASDDRSEENYVYTHLEFLQRGQAHSRVGTVTQFEVLLDRDVKAAAVCREIDELFQAGPVPTATRPKGIFQAKSLGDLTQLLEMAHYLGLACTGLVLVMVATATFMSVQDRVREHAVLQTIGFTPGRVFGLVLIESVLLSLTGGLIGLAVAWIVLQFGDLAVGAEGVMMAFQPTPSLARSAMIVTLVAGLLAGVAPAWQAATARIVPALRHR